MIIQEKHILNDNKFKKSRFPTNIHRTSEPIRDLVDFPKHIYRSREPTRDSIDSRDSEN